VTRSDFDLLELDTAEGVHAGHFRIPQDSPFFDGHFPDSPLLPGVAQVRLVTSLLAAACKSPVRVLTLHRVKFSSPVRPGAIIDFRIEPLPAKGRIAWKFSDARAEVSTGELSLAKNSP
jgi:3-hydroxymyristoyl/3-hydroxydecanoyl-(acyl carrier protein) dehydratase